MEKENLKLTENLIKQLKFARESTLEYVKDMDDRWMELIPENLNNHINWNLGHIYIALEKFAFKLTGEKTHFPKDFIELYSPGTSPRNWTNETPKKSDLFPLLQKQMERVEVSLPDKIDLQNKEAYTTSAGLRIATVGECLSFCIYHEGMHFGAIKTINRLL